MKKFLATLTLALAMVSSAFAATTYNNSKFSADFNGPVTMEDLGLNQTGTGNTVMYKSDTNGVQEGVAVRTINGNIAVNLDSAEFYANQQLNIKGHTLVSRTSKDTSGNDQRYYQGHPFSYICTEFTEDGVKYWMRTRFIIVNSNTVLFVQMLSTAEKSDRDEWTRFEFSLDVK